jgi:hypothetical protein
MLHFGEIFDFDFRLYSETSFEPDYLFDLPNFFWTVSSVVLLVTTAKFSFFCINQFKSISFSWKLKSI